MPSILQACPTTNGDTIELPPGYPEADSLGRARKSYKGKLLDFGRHGTPKSIDRYNRSPVPQAYLESLLAMAPVTTLPFGYPKADARGYAFKFFKGKLYQFGKHGTQHSVDRFNLSPVGKAFAAAAATGKQSDPNKWTDSDGTPWVIGAATGFRHRTLVRHRVEVGGITQHKHVPGKVRTKEVPMSSDFFLQFVWVSGSA